MLCVSIFITIATLQSLVDATNVLTFENRQCDKSGTFLQFFGISLRDCTEECDRRSRCLSIMFMQRLSHCSLKDKVNDDMINGRNFNEAQCMFLKKNDWVSSDLGECNKIKCDDTETCVSTRDQNGYLCLKSTCLSPPVIANAFLLSDAQTVGSINRYHCNSGYMSFGTPVITCNSSAKWEMNGSFWCEKMCTTPRLSYSNAILASTEYTRAPAYNGVIIHFECGKDYQALGPYSTSRCDTNGNWIPQSVRCCPNDTYNITNLCMFYTGPLEVYEQFNTTCSERNFTVSWSYLEPSNYMHVYEGTEFILIPAKKNDFEAYFTECLKRNNTTYNTLTFDEKIHFVKDNNMTQDTCSLATVWAPSEPNGDVDENCIMRKINEYFWYDIRCNNLDIFKIGAFCQWMMPSI